MADNQTALGLLVLAQQFRGDIVKQINRRSILLRVLTTVAGEGKNLAWGAEGDGQVAENYAEGADAANFGGDAQAPATLNWGLYRANLHVTKLAMDAARTSATPLGNQRLWARQVQNGAGKLASILNKAMHNGPGTGTTIFGLDAAVGDATNTYATINRATGGNEYWRPVVIDPGSATGLTFSLLRDDLRQIYEASGEYPQIAICTPRVFNVIGGLFDDLRRYSVDTVNVQKGVVNLDGGFRGLEIDGTVFIKDKDATDNRITYLNTDHVEVQYLPSADVPGELTTNIQGDDGFGAVPLGFSYEMLAKLGASSRAEILATVQVKVDRPNSCGVRLNVA
jgi:hypothetical protein